MLYFLNKILNENFFNINFSTKENISLKSISDCSGSFFFNNLRFHIQSLSLNISSNVNLFRTIN